MNKPLAILGLLLAALCARGDVLVLDTGESMSGTALRVRESVLVFRTSLESGQIMVPLDTVKSLVTEASYVLSMTDGGIVTGRLGVEGGAARLEQANGGAALPLAYADIKEMDAIPQTPKPEPAELEIKGSTGLMIREGTKDTAGPFVQVEVARGGLNLSALGMADPSEEEVNHVDLRLEWRKELESAWEPLIEVSAERDTGNALAWRTGLSLGAGRLIKEWESGSAWWLAGLQVEREEWIGGGVEGLNARLGLRVGNRVLRRTALSTDLLLLPSLLEAGDLRAEARSELSWPLGAKLRLRAQLSLGFDNARGSEDAQAWTGGVAVGMEF